MALLSPAINPFEFSRLVHRPQHHPASASPTRGAVARLRFQADKPHTVKLPVVNYQDLLKGDPKAIESLGNTLRDVGFVALSDHGMDPEKLQRLREATRHLLSQDEALLSKYHHPEIGGEYGYRARKDALVPQTVETKHPVDSKRLWHLGESIRVFPTEAQAPGFRREMSDAYDQLKGIRPRPIGWRCRFFCMSTGKRH